MNRLYYRNLSYFLTDVLYSNPFRVLRGRGFGIYICHRIFLLSVDGAGILRLRDQSMLQWTGNATNT